MSELNLDQIAAFVFHNDDDDLFVEEEIAEEIAEFVMPDLEEVEEIPPMNNNQRVIAALLEDLDVEDNESPVEIEATSESEETPDISASLYREELFTSIAQYGCYWKQERERLKSDVNTKDIRIPSASFNKIKSRSINNQREDTAVLFVQAYINALSQASLDNTLATDTHFFRLWLLKRNQEIAGRDPHNIIRPALRELSEVRNNLYNSISDPGVLESKLEKLITTFVAVAYSHNKIITRYTSAQDVSLIRLAEEVDSLFDPSTRYFDSPIVRMDMLALVDSDSENKIFSEYALATSVFCDKNNDMTVSCECGEIINYKSNLQLFRKKSSPYLRARYAVCPSCHKKVIIHRNISYALGQALLRAWEHVKVSNDQTTIMNVGREELIEAHGFLTAHNNPIVVLNRINPEVVRTSEDILQNFNESEFISSFLDVLDIYALKNTTMDVNTRVMHYLLSINGMPVKMHQMVNFLYLSCAPNTSKDVAEFNRHFFTQTFELSLQKALKGLEKNKAFQVFINSDEFLGSKYLRSRLKKMSESVTLPAEEITQMRKDMSEIIRNMSYDDYMTFATQEVPKSELYYTGLGKVIEDFILEQENYDQICLHLFDLMMRHELEKPKIKLGLPYEITIPKKFGDPLLKRHTASRTRVTTYISVSDVFNAFSLQMEDTTLAAVNESKRFTQRIFDLYCPPLQLNLPGKFGNYFYHLTMINSLGELRTSYLSMTVDNPDPWANNPGKTLFLYAILKACKGTVYETESTDDLIEFLEEMGEGMCSA